MKEKYITWFIILVSVVAVGIPRVMSVDTGLPYNQFWDEPLLTEGALNGLKRMFDGNRQTNFLPVSSEVVYGGFMRYTMMLQDAIYFNYLLLTDPEVHSLADVKTSISGEQILTTSHPGFYYWNRIYHVSLSVLAFIIVFLIVRKIFGYEYGSIAVVILAANYYYYDTSYVFVTNVPLGTMTIITIFFAVQYNYSKKYRHLLLSLVFSGLSMATKMTGAATLLIPLIAGLSNYSYLKEQTILITLWKAFYLGLIPLTVFLIFTPSVYLNAGHFFYWMNWLSNLYKTGGPHSTMEPGMEHFMFQINLLIKNHGSYFSGLALLGIVTGLAGITDVKRTKKEHLISNTLILVLFPLIYLLYVTFQYKISYHRNFTLYYPILAVLSAMGVSFIINSFLQVSSKVRKEGKWVVLLVALIIFYLNLPVYKSTFKSGSLNHQKRDTRTLTVKKFTSIVEEPFHLGIESGLKISFDDLRNIRTKYGFFNISEMDSAFQGFTHLLVPDYQFKKGPLSAFPDTIIDKINRQISENMLASIKGSKLDYFHYMALWTPIVNPTVRILQASTYPPPLINQYLVPIFNYPLVEVLDHIEDPVFKGLLRPAKYKLSYKVSGTPAHGEYPIVELKINGVVLDSIETSHQQYAPGSLKFTVIRPEEYKIELRLLNDYWNAETGEDRNAYFKSLTLKREIDINE